ncbi:RNA polymerase sigma factor [Streptomyces sp. SAJ15]|uniref:RNA polymerase sigma factor n=1 Tax=Streptomyces sp. SAJ15 TaxID=2011095 RepID=UPI001185353F|nr:sigma-70 family RNA polymerase sigma factor [Streptomyces sp. SAJ15]TVL87782.1 RNA polymerase subunit sigma [Streptomyces sp. SAJ15]
MTTHQPDPWEEPVVREDLAAVLPVDFRAFYSQHVHAYLRYAHIQLGSRTEAEQVVEDVFTQLAQEWGLALQQPSVAGYAMAALKEEISRRIEERGRGVALVETAAFAAVRGVTRMRMESLESRLGLYAAIARLPERHYDVVVLRFVLGYTTPRVAHIMGITRATVRSHIRGARRRLARELGIDWNENEGV